MPNTRTIPTGSDHSRIHKRPPTKEWAVSLISTNVVHVYPLDDLRGHSTRDCWCPPVDDEGLVIHKSLDGREFYETGERKAS
jgi:hypothetical protein